jgi:ribosomal protein S18 acetylase RimI-like enzyme
VKSGNWLPEEAKRRSREEHTQWLPDGFTSANQHLYTIQLDGVPVGDLWLSTGTGTVLGVGFIYDLFINEEFRRQGIATEAMRLLEREAYALGLSNLALHVFGGNLVGSALYEKLGYEITNINMSKSLSAN